MRLTLRPRLSSRQPIEAAARPLPREDTTPPVTKIYFADMSSSYSAFQVKLGFGLKFRLGWILRVRFPGSKTAFAIGRGTCRGARPIIREILDGANTLNVVR